MEACERSVGNLWPNVQFSVAADEVHFNPWPFPPRGVSRVKRMLAKRSHVGELG